jgi:alpha-mannosidase
MADDMRDRKAAYVYSAGRESTTALESGLAVLASRIKAPENSLPGLMVFNSLGWESSPLVRVMVPQAGEYQVVEMSTGKEMPCELETTGAWPEHYLSFVATGLPAFGTRCYSLKLVSTERVTTELPVPYEADWTLQNSTCHLSLDPISGAVSSFYNQKEGRELVNSASGYGANQFLHYSDGVLSTTTLQKVTKYSSPLSSRLVVEMRFPYGGSLRSTYTLYPDSPALDISNEIERPASHEAQCSWFAFPLAVESSDALPGGAYFYDSPGAILHAGGSQDGGDQIPGAGMTCFCVQSFLAAQGSQAYAVLASPDAHLFQFGEHILQTPTADSHPRSPLALSNVMNNFTRNDFATNQGGQTRFTFRYRLGSGSGSIAPDAALRFAGSFARPAASVWLMAGSGAANITPTPHSFLSVSPANVIATTFKAAENGQGWVVRLWEVGGKATRVTIDLQALGVKHVYLCDLLERVKESLEIQNGQVRLNIPARGLAAIRFA